VKKYSACSKDFNLSLIVCFKPRTFHALTKATMGGHCMLFFYRLWRTFKSPAMGVVIDWRSLMRATTNRSLVVMVLTALFLIPSVAEAKEETDNNFAVAEQEARVEVPNLAQIIPLATVLSGRLATLENDIAILSQDVSEFENRFAVIEKNLRGPYDELQKLKDTKDYKYKKLVTLSGEITREHKLFDGISRPLSKSIRKVGAWRKEWLAEKKRWNEWQSFMTQEGIFDQLKGAFETANETIETALKLLVPQLESMLAIQTKAGNIQTQIYILDGEIDRLISTGRRSDLTGKYLPLFSFEYFSQYKGEMLYQMLRGLDEVTLPDRHSLARSGWIVFLQFFFSLVAIIAVYRNQQVLKDHKRWQFLLARPYSTGLFVGAMATMGFYDYIGVTLFWKQTVHAICMISLARMVGGTGQTHEKLRLFYGLIVVLLITRILDLISLPLPLFRLYIVLTAVLGIVFCSRWTERSRRRNESGLYTRLFRLLSLFLVVIIIAELFGKHGLAYYLLISSFITIFLVVAFLFFGLIIRGVFEWLFSTSLLRRAAMLHKDANTMVRQAKVFVDIVVWGLLLLPALLLTWRVYDSFGEAYQGLMAFGFKLGSQKISIGLVITAVGILYATFVASWTFQKVLIDQVLARRNVEMGVRHAMARLAHYVIVFLGFLFVLSALGLEVTKLTIMLSALSVGIGFGLQGIANNFVSGIILLFERPVRVGDLVQMGDRWATIKRIGLRSTTVITVEDSELIVPNANLVNDEVTNWTRSNRRARFEILVGVAYGSDIPLVLKTLMACAKEHPKVAKTHEPQVLFQGFGNSSLDFALRAWVYDIDYRLSTMSELRQEIDRRFREAKIVIPFPQRDLHVCSVDESIDSRPRETTE
jgi:small-conductance mechanosensitive channel